MHPGKRAFKLIDQPWIKGFKGSKTNAQLRTITNKKVVLTTSFFSNFFAIFLFFSVSILSPRLRQVYSTQQQRQFLLANRYPNRLRTFSRPAEASSFQPLGT